MSAGIISLPATRQKGEIRLINEPTSAVLVPPILAARRYVSPRSRPITPEEAESRRIARTCAVLDHALTIQATPTSEERIGDILIRDDAEAGQVVIKFPSNHTPEFRKRIRSAGFCTKGPRRAFRLRKISAGANAALEDARWLVREILGED